ILTAECQVRIQFFFEKGFIAYVPIPFLDILKANNVHFTYHVYHENNFGLYQGYGKPVDPTKANTGLIELFTKKLKP
ncbi:MAG TPA: hypothetical protein VM010_06435, partial [Chitinophagaceae bacterium]|nr:hypothetical protein [Chitinophagaceae bacterium]